MANVFRQTSLDRISSPDQLDRLLIVTKPLSWIGVVAAAVLAAVVTAWAFVGSLPVTMDAMGYITPDTSTNTVFSSTQGKVSAIHVRVGSRIEEGMTVADVVSADGASHAIVSSNSGVVDSVLVKQGDELVNNAEIVRYSTVSSNDNVLLCLVPYAQAPQLAAGVSAKVTLADGNTLSATVANVDRFIASPEALSDALDPTGQIAAQLMAEGPVVAVTCTFDDAGVQQVASAANMPASVQFFVSERTPISMILPILGAR